MQPDQAFEQIVSGRVGRRKRLRLGVGFLVFGMRCFAQQQDLTQLSLEDLMNTKVTSASKQAESLSGAPAAIFVLTGEDIRRGGFATLPDALRMVPGLYVAQTNAHLWQVSARGFSDLDNNKMLVLVDGRSVYSPELGTVYWDTLDIPLENIERVEIIRGPGGALWGANAVNGVINIVTKNAQATQGMMVSTSDSAEEGYSTTVRYGGQIGSNLAYSAFGRASYWEPFGSPSGNTPPDSFALPQAGLRADWAASSKDVVTIETGGYDGRQGSNIFQTNIPATYLLKGGHTLVHWKRTISERNSVETLAYCDWYARFGAPGEKRNSCDLEFQHTHQFTPRQSLISGGSFFTTGDDLTPDPAPYRPERRRTNVFSGFAQYEIKIIPDRLRILGGTKLEHNDYTGFEYQPQGRMVWTPNKVNTVWTSVSRSVRVPSRNGSDLDLVIPVGPINGEPSFLSVLGNPDLQSEHILAYELGYRVEPVPTLSFDLALYYNQYHNLIVTSPPAIEILPQEILLSSEFINGPDAETNGAELSAKWQPVHSWTISAGVTETHGSAVAVNATPEYLFNVQSRLNLPHRIEFDSGLYHYSSIAVGQDTGAPATTPFQGVPNFNRVDVGVGWHPASQWTFSVWGRNLQSDKHVETRDTILSNEAEYVPRSVAFKLVWQLKPEKSSSGP
jgi:iron complex outermembrane receptor protein